VARLAQSSSFHFLSGDRKLSAPERIIYSGSYLAERVLAAVRSSAIPVNVYEPTLDRAAYIRAFGEAALDASASRVLCYDFIACHGGGFFGPDRAVIDLGCGHGNYAAHIRRAFGYRRYAGYDLAARPEWVALSREDTTFTVKELGVDSIDVSKADTIFSQSVLEHVAYDTAVFRRFSAETPRRLSHLHFVPALRSYGSYRFHGYRRYSPYQLDRLTGRPGIRAVRAFAFGNSLSRSMHLDHYDHLAKRPRKRERHSPFDPSKSMFENLLIHRDEIRPKRQGDADFFALIFEQDVG
jgi:SAM-dependent methyltransferase